MPRIVTYPKHRDLEGLFLKLWRALGLRGWEPVTQHRFHPTRQWPFDFAWPSARVAVEIDGGAFVGGAHNRGRGQMNDAEKRRQALRLGWVVIVVVGTELDERPCDVIDDIKDILQQRKTVG